MPPNSSSKSASVNKLDLSAPPPPPPPEDNRGQQSHPARGRGRGDFSNNGQRGRGRGDFNTFSGNRGRESSNFTGNRGRGNRGSFGNGFNGDRGSHYYQGRGGFGGGYNHHDEDNTEYDDQGYDDMDLENDNDEYQEQGVPDWRGPQSNNQNIGEAASSNSLRPGDWRCKKCDEINFARREKCRKCSCDKNFVPPPVSDSSQGDGAGDTLDNFDRMFENWERTYSTWREENRHNPDRDYVRSYTEQMEAMRASLMEKRRKIERSQDMFRSWHSDPGGIPGIDQDTVTNAESEQSGQKSQPPTSDVVNRILDDNDYDDSDDDRKEETKPEVMTKKSRWGENSCDHSDSSVQPRVKKSRWEVDPEDNLDIDQMRRRPANGGQQQNNQLQPFSGPSRPVLFPSPSQSMSNRGRGQVFGQNKFPHQRPNFNQRQQRQDDDFEQFWKPAEVTDYSQKQNDGGRFSQERDFRPQTFDYSHGGGGRGRGNGRQVQSRFSPAPAPAAPPKPSGACVMIDSILTGEGRRSRPPKIVIILRGVPGSGKSHLAKLIKNREMEAGGEKLRTMCLDDYFDVDGVYEYEPEMEESYRASFLKSFKKTVDGNLFSFILVDAVHNKVSQFREFWSYAKQNGFEVGHLKSPVWLISDHHVIGLRLFC